MVQLLYPNLFRTRRSRRAERARPCVVPAISCAPRSRHGQILNKTDLAAPLGVSVPAIGDWLHVSEISGQIILVPPYFENFGKRLLRSLKVYIGDSGLACFLLGIATQAELERSPFLGAIFEGFIAAEILKSQVNQGKQKEIHHFRDQQGLEVDFLFPSRRGGFRMVECKLPRQCIPPWAHSLSSLRRAIYSAALVQMAVVHRPSATGPKGKALSPGVRCTGCASLCGEPLRDCTLGVTGRKTERAGRLTCS